MSGDGMPETHCATCRCATRVATTVRRRSVTLSLAVPMLTRAVTEAQRRGQTLSAWATDVLEIALVESGPSRALDRGRGDPR
jgi:hypothetical protein